jgi:hypothetical protein
MSNSEKSKQLGMPHGTAANRLRKKILFALLELAELNECWRCGEKMGDIDEFSIDHIEPWLHSNDPIGLYFDLDNVAFSHIKCNIAASRNTLKGTGQTKQIRNKKKNAQLRSVYTTEKRQERYKCTGH